MPDYVTVRCGCGQAMQAGVAHLGQEARCTACGASFLLWPEDEGAGRSAKATWYVRVAGRELGPFEPDDLRKFVGLGRIQPETPVRKGAAGDWVAARQVRGLLAAPAATTAAATSKSARLPRASRAAGRPAGRAPRRVAPAGSVGTSPRRPRGAPPPRVRGDWAARLARQPGVVLAMALGGVVIVVLVVVLATRGGDDSATSAPQETSAAATRGVAADAGSDPTASSKKPKVLTTEQVVARCAPSVAVVMGRNGSGTGFLVAQNVIATNRHVISDELMRHVTVQFPDAEKHLRGNYGAKLLYEDPDLDLAFLDVPIELPALALAEDHHFVRGEEITVIGSPGVGNGQILANAISRGLMSTEAEVEGHTYYQLDVAINPGNSGGPVFDKRGQVIGVVTLKATNKDGLGFCLPLASLRSALARSKRLSPDDRRTMAAMHRMRVTSLAVLRSAEGYAMAGDLYVRSMEKAMAEGVDLNVGLAAARAVLSGHLMRMDGRLLAELRSDAPQVLGDLALPDDSRKRFEGLWATYNALKEHIENPSGTFTSYKQRCENLNLARGRIAVELNKEDGVPLDDG